MTVAVTGRKTTIIAELKRLVPDEEFVSAGNDTPIVDRYVLAAGLLRPKRFFEQSDEERRVSAEVNFFTPVWFCERALTINPRVRICVVGSESGYGGSYDAAYGAMKAALHHYVETRRLEHPGQQLVAVAPGIIEDAGMTVRRTDVENLYVRRDAHSKQRFLRAVEVARMIKFLLWDDEGYTTGTVIRMHG